MITQREIELAASSSGLQLVSNPTRATIADAFEEGAKWALCSVVPVNIGQRRIEIEAMITGLQEAMRPLLEEWSKIKNAQ